MSMTPDELAVDTTLAALGPCGETVGSDNRQVDLALPEADLADLPAAPLVYRRFRDPDVAGEALRELVSGRAVLPPVRRARLDAVTRWPVRLVVGESSSGVVLPAVPESFLQAIRLPSGDRRVVPRTIGLLMLTPGRASRLGLPTPDLPTRVALCRALAEAVERVHDAGVAAGALDGERILFLLRPRPAVLLDGCTVATTQLDDRRALGLTVLRLLTPGPDAWAAGDPQRAADVLGRPGVALLAAAIDGPADRRPSARDWIALLRDVEGGEDRPAVLDEAVLDRTVIPPGDPLAVSWSARWADEVWIGAPGIDPVRTDSTTEGVETLVPTSSGPITMRLVNRAGVGEWTAGRIVVLEPPSLHDLPVPMPRMDLPIMHMPDLPSAVAALPDLPIEASPAQWDTGPTTWFDPPPRPTPLPDPAPEVGNPPGFDAGAASFPIDIVSIMSAAPPLRRSFWTRRNR